MTMPTAPVVTTNLDVGIDSPASARTDLLDAVTKLNQIIGHTSSFAATLLDDADAPAARATLGVAPRATRIDVASVAGTVDLTTNAPNTDDIRITGALAITAFTVAVGRVIRVTAGGAFTLTNNSNIVTQTGANIVAASGDTFVLRATATNTVEVLSYTKILSSVQIQSITSSVAGNQLTVVLNPTTLDFRSATLTDGVPNTRTVGSALTLVVPAGATLGTVNATQARLALLAIDNAGTVELTIVNLAGGVNLDETTLISTTAISAVATSASVVYSITARINVPFRVVGFLDITQATAGSWATAPSTIQGAGGNALSAMSSLGYGQTWQDVTASRALATTYYNTTGKPITILASLSVGASSNSDLTINGTSLGNQTGNGNANAVVIPITFVVPPGQSYRMAVTVGGVTINKWSEQR